MASNLRQLLILILLESATLCHGCCPQEVPEDTLVHDLAPSDRIPCTDSGEPLEDFDFCVGYPSDPGFDNDTHWLDITGTVVEQPSLSFGFRTCADVYDGTETFYVESDSGKLLKFAFPGHRGGMPAFPQGLFPVDGRLRVRLQAADATGSIALRLDSEAAHVAGTRYGLVVPPVSEFTVVRGPADGPPQDVECGIIQQDLFEVAMKSSQRLVAVGECADIDGVMFLGIQAFHPIENICSDGLAPLTWIAAWPGTGEDP